MTILEREVGHAPELREDLATIAVLDLGVLTRLGGLDAIAAGAPGEAVRAWIEVAREPPASTARRGPRPRSPSRSTTRRWPAPWSP